jgi:hypothetical protein
MLIAGMLLLANLALPVSFDGQSWLDGLYSGFSADVYWPVLSTHILKGPKKWQPREF